MKTTFKTFYEAVNKDVFHAGYFSEKSILNGEYTLKAMGTELPNDSSHTPVLRISAHDASDKEIGWVVFTIERGWLLINKHIEAYKVVVSDEHRRKGIAQEMYKFAKELGNTVKPSKFQSDAGKAFWKSLKQQKVI